MKEGLPEGTEVLFHFIMEANEDEGDKIVSLGPDDSNASAGASLKDFIGATSVEQFDAEAGWRLASGVEGANVLVGFDDEGLLSGGKAIEALEVALLVDEPHLPLFHPPLQDRAGRAFIGDDVARVDREGILEKRCVGFRRNSSAYIHGLKDDQTVEKLNVEVVASNLEMSLFHYLLRNGELVTPRQFR